MTQAEFQFIAEAIKKYAEELTAKVYSNAVAVADAERKAIAEKAEAEAKKAKETK